MKKTVVIAFSMLMCICVFFGGCTASYDKSPDQFKNIRWETPDYSFIINPSDGCKGVYKFNDKKYSIKAVFDGSYLSVKDTANKNTELFNAQWTYDKDELYIYDISFNEKSYKEFKENYSEYVKLKKAKLK